MRKILLLLALVACSTIADFAQKVDGKEIRDRDIEWSDFSGAIDKTSKYNAFTFWVTTYSFSPPKIINDIVHIKLRVRLFLRSDSWVKQGKESDRLLKHERGHYRIGRICANEIEKTINSMDFSRSNYHREVETVYWEIIEKYREINKQYDIDTDHFNNLEQQAIWDKKLEKLLNQ